MLRIAITGSSGLVGRALSEALHSRGDQVLRLVRPDTGSEKASYAAVDSWPWNPESGLANATQFPAVDCIIHLAGRSIAAARWNDSEKRRLRDSRVAATRLLCEQLAALQNPPRTFIGASAVGIYGDRGNETITESSVRGKGFMADLADEWESASQPLAAIGTRIAHARFGVVISVCGGALQKMMPLFRWGLGGRLGSGHQFWSWISLEDVVRALIHLIDNSESTGPYNLCSPQAVTNSEFTRALGRALHRPTIFPAPAAALRFFAGEMADAVLLAGCRAVPERLEAEGFIFRHATIESALGAELEASRH
ncbi:MAG: TIGR01777 family oxidoreductase [Pirellulales bacterium]